MKTAVCCIGREENRYIREFIEWYKTIGFSHIILYDNNNPDGESFNEIIDDYIQDGYVEIINYRGKEICQKQAYTECYHNNKNKYDWIAFFDCDEFLQLKNCSTITEYLSNPIFRNFDMIHINWMVYGDNDVVSDELKPLCERFPNPIPVYTKIAYNFPENCHIKSIVRGNLEDLVWTGNGFVHTPSPTTLRCCNNTGVSCDGNSPFLPVDHTLAFIKHYTTKTANEYCNKMLRGFPDQKWDGSLVKYLIETRFFRTNKITQEKIDIFKNRLGVDMSYLLNFIK